MSGVDLHVHTNASDGRYTPAEIISRAVMAGLKVLSITDHDTVAGIVSALEAVKAFPELKLIPGVEINTDVPAGEAHILGYFIDHKNPELLSLLKDMRNSRYDRAMKMVAKLKALGMPLSGKRVLEIASTGAIGRPHIAQALLEMGYISSLKEAFDKYISRNGPAYVERSKVSPAQATELILKSNGLPVFAHPFTVSEPENMIRDLKAIGLVGIEIYYGGYTSSDIGQLLGLAKKYSLIATGGSDFHGLDEISETPLGQSRVPMSSARQLIALAIKRQCLEATTSFEL